MSQDLVWKSKYLCRSDFMIFRWLWLLLLAAPLAAQAQFVIVTNKGAITINNYYDTGEPAVVIPDETNGLPVTAIAADAFNQIDNMTSLTIGTNVTTIGTNAIFQCSSLSSVTLPNSVTNFGQGPFFDCKALTTFTATFSNAFYLVTNGLIMNRTLTSLVQYPSALTGNYNLPFSVTNVNEALIGNSLNALTADPTNANYTATNGVLFSKNLSVLVAYPGSLAANYVVPAKTTVIASGAFEYSPSLITVTIGTNVISIGYAALFDCQSLSAIEVSPTNAFYSTTNGVLYNKAKTMLIQYPAALGGNYTVLNTVTNIGDGAFGDAFSLNSVVIPNGVVNIGFEAFYACFNLSAISLGSGLRTIQPDAFFLCTSLPEVSFPGSVTNIGAYAFGAGYALDYVCFQGQPPTDGGNIFYYDSALAQILYVSGNAGWGATYDGIPTATCSACEGLPSDQPILSISRSGADFVVSWPNSFSGFTLEYTTNLSAAATPWQTNSPAAVVANTNYVSTNGISGARKFYRLIQ